MSSIKPGFYTSVELDASGCGYQCSQTIPVFAIKVCVLAWNLHVKLSWGDARLMALYAVTATCGNRERRMKKIFCLLEKKRKAKEQFYNPILNVLRDLHTSRCKRLLRPYDVCLQNRQNAIKFARANNSDLLRAPKHLMKTRFYGRYWDWLNYLLSMYQ